MYKYIYIYICIYKERDIHRYCYTIDNIIYYYTVVHSIRQGTPGARCVGYAWGAPLPETLYMLYIHRHRIYAQMVLYNIVYYIA